MQTKKSLFFRRFIIEYTKKNPEITIQTINTYQELTMMVKNCKYSNIINACLLIFDTLLLFIVYIEPLEFWTSVFVQKRREE